MYLVRNALKNIVRNKGRYLLIGAVLIVMLASVTVSAMIHFTTKAVIDDYANRFGAAVTFTPDLRKLITLMKPDENGYYHDPEITAEQYIAFSKSDALKSTLFQGSRQTYCDTLTGLDQGGEENYYASGQGNEFTAKDPHPETVRRQAPNTVLLGYSDTSMLEDFALGLRELDEGHFFTSSDSSLRDRDAEYARKRETLSKADQRIAELDRIISRLYEDNVTGKLTDERFIKMSHDFEQEQGNLKSMAEVLRKELKQQEQQKTNVRAFIKVVKKYTDMQELDATILREFIDRIEVSHVDKKSKTREITIVYNFIGAFDFARATEEAQNTTKQQQRTA